jgi:hypothetical protein
VELVRGGGAGLHRAGSGYSQLAQRLDRSSARLRGHGRIAGQHRPGGSLGIHRVGLPATASVLSVGSVHLHDTHAASCEVAGQSRPPRPAALDTHRQDLTETTQPHEQPSIPVTRRRERRRRQDPAHVVDHRRDVHVLMCIHTTENPALDTRLRDCGHATPSINRTGWHAPPGGRTGQ